MRLRIAAAVALWMGASAGLAVVANAAPDDPDVTLSAAEVHKAFARYEPAVESCYVNLARGKKADGTLRLELIIHRDGTVFTFAFTAAGVEQPSLGKLDACLRELVPSWQFPPRKGFTTVVLPFLYQHTHAPGAGPIESCWDPRGCPPGVAKGSR